MKVLSITPTYFPKVGGIESFVRELAIRTSVAGTTVDVAHLSADYTDFSREEVDDIGVFRVPVSGNRLVGYARGLGELARNYDLLHVHDPQLMMVTGNVRLQCGQVPAVLSTHGGFLHTRQHRAMKSIHEKLVMRKMLRHYRRILADSQADAEYFRRFSDNVEKCECGIDFDKFQHGRTVGQPDPTRWICWGRWANNKRIDAVIDAVALARDNGIAIDLLICGPDFDNLGPSLRAKIEALKLGGAVKMHPYIENDALLKELQQRSVYITGTEYEGFGIGINEALAAGKIAVCRDIAPINDFVEASKTGFFIKFDGSAGDLATIREITNLPPTRVAAMAAAAQQSARRYDWNTVAQNFSRQYEQALSV